jgi:hypothetical protein
MSKTFTASDRKTLIRLASNLPEGSAERRAILTGLSKSLPQGSQEKVARYMPAKDVWYKVIYPALQKAGISGPDAYEAAKEAIKIAYRDLDKMIGGPRL